MLDVASLTCLASKRSYCRAIMGPFECRAFHCSHDLNMRRSYAIVGGRARSTTTLRMQVA